MRSDFAVRVGVYFTVEVGANDRNDAVDAAFRITNGVFAESFSRARDLDISIVEVETLDPPAAPPEDQP